MTTSISHPQPASAPTAVDLLLNLYDVKITPEHEASFADFRDHVYQYLALSDQIRAAELNLAAQKDQSPRQPQEVEDWREWVIYTERVKRHNAEIELQKKVVKGLHERRLFVFQALRQVMPSMVWFKVDQWAVGMSYTNWGSDNYNLVIKRWGTHKSTSLDLTVRGD